MGGRARGDDAMADLRTTVTELATGLGTLAHDSVGEAIAARPPEMVSVSPEVWELLAQAHDGGALSGDFERAWCNGVAFSQADDGLRGRRPIVIEWKGSHRAPGDEVAPIDLRIDHVYLVSCKYLSKILINASPAFLFERLLRGGHGVRGGDWYAETAPAEYQRLYALVRHQLGSHDLPSDVRDVDGAQRQRIGQALRAGWPGGTEALYRDLGSVVADTSARRWHARLTEERGQEAMLWRLLRMGSSPYFVLGTSVRAPLRIRVATPWDWRLRYQVRRFECTAQAGGQPRVRWVATVEDRHTAAVRSVEGHVEIRWSHGRFSSNPEAKVYLDTPHHEVPGYFPLR